MDGDVTLRVLCLIFSCSIIADTYLTYEWTQMYNGREENPFWINKLKYPALVVTIDLGIMSGVTFAATEVGKKNNPLACAAVACLCMVQGYYLYRHYWSRQHAGGYVRY